MPWYGFLETTFAALPEFGDLRHGLRQGSTPTSMACTSWAVICFRIEALVGILAVFHARLLFCP
jgi:plasmid stabilization system protein ParE